MDTYQQWMQLALEEAQTALTAGDFPVGCVFVHENQVVARGHRLNSRPGQANEMDHAEIIALRSLLTEHPHIDPGAVILYSTMEPCLMCYTTLLLNGVRNFVYAYEDVMGGGTGLDLSTLNPLYSQMAVRVVPSVLRLESLVLFQRFFAQPENDYWQGSLLAEYTLKQSDDRGKAR